jgi:hypothetical protein
MNLSIGGLLPIEKFADKKARKAFRDDPASIVDPKLFEAEQCQVAEFDYVRVYSFPNTTVSSERLTIYMMCIRQCSVWSTG